LPLTSKHGAHARVYANVTKEVDEFNVARPASVVDHLLFVDCLLVRTEAHRGVLAPAFEELCQSFLQVDRVLLDATRRSLRALGRTAGRVADEACCAPDECEHAMPTEL
jgi:hypothetical protein